jgi:hypothetical protein
MFRREWKLKYNNGEQKVIPINWIDESDRWIVVPGTVLEKRRRRIKEVPFSKNNCSFATGVPRSIFDFIYRCVKQLKLTDRRLFFSRGMVRTSKKIYKNAVAIRELDWGVGTLIIIPRLLKYREKISLHIENTEYSFRLMEVVVLHGLLQIACPGKDAEYYSTMAALILARGWNQLELKELPTIIRKS